MASWDVHPWEEEWDSRDPGDIVETCRCGCIIRKRRGSGPWVHLSGRVWCSDGSRAEPREKTS